MIAKSQPIKRMAVTQATRASVTFPPEVYSSLEAIARRKKVSVAWVVRDAVEKYVAEERKRPFEAPVD